MNLLLAAVLLLQDKSAEETFKKIEEKIFAAKSLSVTFSISPEKDPGPFVMTGFYQIKGGDKWRLELDFKDKDRPSHRLQISDGVSVRTDSDGHIEKHDARPPNSNRECRVILSRLGYLETWGVAFVHAFSSDGSKTLDLEKSLVLSDFQNEVSEGDACVLTYTVTPVLEEEPLKKFKVKLHYDSKTLLPVKRVVQRGDSDACIENFRDWALNADIPDEKFTLPEEKK